MEEFRKVLDDAGVDKALIMGYYRLNPGWSCVLCDDGTCQRPSGKGDPLQTCIEKCTAASGDIGLE